MSSMPFDIMDFMRRVGRRLVNEFDDASQGTTPSIVGAAREHPARKQLERMLPGSAQIQTGVIIDSFGAASKQEDIVIFERDNCPIFSINDTPESTYFPCECVIAVGEVKSRLDSAALTDAFEKIASAKRLRRFAARESNGFGPEAVPFRRYGSVDSTLGTPDEEFDQTNKSLDQVFGFILCGEFGLKPETMADKLVKLYRAYPRSEVPNLIVSLTDGFFHPLSKTSGFVFPSDASDLAYSDEAEKGFASLVQSLHRFIRHGRTVEIGALRRYFYPAGQGTTLDRIQSFGSKVIFTRPL